MTDRPVVPWHPSDPGPPPPVLVSDADLSRAKRRRQLFLLGVAVVVSVAVVLGALNLEDAVPAGAWESSAHRTFDGDSWDGNLVTDGSRVYLLSREAIDGFWGALRVRWSDDAGRTWSKGYPLANAGWAARPTLAIEPDGTLWAAWAQRGVQPSSQGLMLRRSTDRGVTWDAPRQVSIDEVGVIGVPALVMTPEQRFITYTDGANGRIYEQPLTPDGQDVVTPTLIGATRRNLYTDTTFLDAGLAATAIGPQAIIAANDGPEVILRVTEDHIASHTTDAVKDALWSAPRVGARDGRVVDLVATRDGPRAHVVASRSTDRGETWEEQARWTGEGVGDLSLSVGAERDIAMWEACRDACASTELRVADVSGLEDGGLVIASGSRLHPVGAVVVGSSLVVAWVTEARSGEPEERRLTVASGQLPEVPGNRP